MSIKSMLKRGSILSAPGVYDGLTAKIVEEAGFEAVYMTGYGTCASWGLPDLGLLTMRDMAWNAERIAAAVNIPVIADADTGYGDARNAARTVELYERAGVSALHVEDQGWPKRCGHMAGKVLVEADEMIDKIKAMVDARHDEDFLIIARTDAIAVESFDAAVDRAGRYSAAGADVLFVEAPESRAQMAAIPRALPDDYHLINLAPRTPDASLDDLAAMGYAIAIFPGICLTAAIGACRDAAARLKADGVSPNAVEWRERFDEINAFLGAGPRSPRESERV